MQHISQILTIANIVVMVALIIMITLQNRSSGLSGVFGSGGGLVQTRRGFEKWLFYATIIFAFLFVGITMTVLLLNK